MSEPLGVEERARLRTLAENREQIFPSQVLSLLDEVDRLTEALEAMTGFRDECEQQYQVAIHAQGRAEADLAAKDEQIECLVADRKTEHDGRHRAEQALAAMTAERDMLDRVASGYQADLADARRQVATAWQEAHDAFCEEGHRCDGLGRYHPNPYKVLPDTATEETGTL